MSVLSRASMYRRFIFGMPAFLRRPPVTLEEAHASIRAGIANRGSNFLHIARHAIYENPHSGYLPLLRMAGCEFGDIEKSVTDDGLGATLEKLRANGVYVTFEEYKGRKPLVRGSQTIDLQQLAFDNPITEKAYAGTTGGSTGVGTRVETDLDNMRSQAPHLMVVREINDLLGAPMAVWKGELPDPVGIGIFLRCAAYGGTIRRWFTPVTRDYYQPPLRFRLGTRYVVWMSRLCGLPCPPPEPLPLERAGELAHWAAKKVAQEGRCEVVAAVSLGVRVCVAAAEAGLDLTGVVFVGGGEPFTPAKNAAFRRVGARYVALYISEDTGPTGLPCAHPLEENDQHLLEDNLAMIQYPREVPGSGVKVDAFYFTSLQRLSSKVLLNMESDDYGIVEKRACGCPLEDLGYTTHVRRIRSFGKLTGEGVTLVGSDMTRILEEVLPARFNAGPQDFQLLEEEDDQGLTRLALLVHPNVDLPPDDEVIEVLLQAIADSSDAGGLASSFWQQAETFSVRRQEPIWTARGKFMPIRVAAIHDRPAEPAAVAEGNGEDASS